MSESVLQKIAPYKCTTYQNTHIYHYAWYHWPDDKNHSIGQAEFLLISFRHDIIYVIVVIRTDIHTESTNDNPVCSRDSSLEFLRPQIKHVLPISYQA